jgi:hypothetical protein
MELSRCVSKESMCCITIWHMTVIMTNQFDVCLVHVRCMYINATVCVHVSVIRYRKCNDVLKKKHGCLTARSE